MCISRKPGLLLQTQYESLRRVFSIHISSPEAHRIADLLYYISTRSYGALSIAIWSIISRQVFARLR